MLGASANVINNISSLGGKVSIFGVLGEDVFGKWAKEKIETKGVDTAGLICLKNRKTSIKTRIIANKQQVVRVDDEEVSHFSPDVYERILTTFAAKKSEIDVVVVSDYSKGLITESLMTELLKITGDLPVIVDPKVGNFRFYKNVYAITPNASEACTFTHVPNDDNRESALAAGEKIFNLLNCKNLLITRGEYGMMLFEGEKNISDISTLAREVSDVSGAGDTVISVLALGIASGLDIKTSAYISNLASGIVVGKLGTASVTREELLAQV